MTDKGSTERLTRADVAAMLPVDSRLAMNTVELAAAVAAELNAAIESTSGGFALPKEAWKMFCLYYAARIYGAFSGSIMLRVHTFDREAQFLERAIYEYYTKLLFYAVLKSEASKAFMSFPKQHLKLIEKMTYTPSRFLTQEQMEMVEAALDYNADSNFAALRARMLADTRFTRQYERPPIKFYLKETRNRFNVDWIAPSQVVHGSLMDIIAAWKLEHASDGSMSATGELESLGPLPNAQLLDSCQFAIYTAVLIEEEFKLSEPPQRSALLHRLISAFDSVEALDTALC